MVINDSQPQYCVDRAMHLLNRRARKAINGAKVLVLGVAYKNDIDDYRESPAIHVIEELLEVGAEVKFYDPWISSFKEGTLAMDGENELTKELLEEADLVMVTTAHSNVDYELVQRYAKLIFDTKNVMKNITERGNIEVL